MVKILEKEYEKWDAPAKRFESAYRRTPYTIMISVILSFRTKDEVTLEAGKRLFAIAETPEDMVTLKRETIEKCIYPVGFYRKKAATILEVSQYIVENYGGEVPSTEEELLKIRGIGPKAANIILESAFGHKTVAVDTHLHRILNLWECIDTSSPKESFRVLKEGLTPDEQAGLNKLLVSFGQTICKPSRADCGSCPVESLCPATRLRSTSNIPTL